MNRFFAAPLLFGTILLLELVPCAALGESISIVTVPVGNPGNANDSTGFGGVGYSYRIGTHEVTNSQYAAFLNAKAMSDPFALWIPTMESEARGGIARTGVSGGYTYAPKENMGDKPVNLVNWYDAIRFVNWLHNGQGNGDTENGAYTLGALDATGIPINGASIARNAGASWFLPNENEWYKAAYHQPVAQGGDSDSYWLYPTATNGVPSSATANGVGDINPGANVVNYNRGADWNGQDGNVTTVGSAGISSASFYGTFDQGGNVWEWNEDVFSGDNRVRRGGSWGLDGAGSLSASHRDSDLASVEILTDGFRVATIPEPSSAYLAALALVTLLAWRRRLS